jgi:transcriptional antiterminator RfaH
MNAPDNPMASEGGRVWHVVSCKPRQEAVAEEQLRRQGFAVYLPRIATRQRRNGAWREGVQALFPRYLFLHVDRFQQNIAPIRSTRGAMGLVRFGGEPAVVPDEVVAAIRAREMAGSGGHYADPARQFRAGERVCVLDGPLAGLDGIFASDDGEARAVILMELLGQTNRVRVSRDWIAKAA